MTTKTIVARIAMPDDYEVSDLHVQFGRYEALSVKAKFEIIEQPVEGTHPDEDKLSLNGECGVSKRRERSDKSPEETLQAIANSVCSRIPEGFIAQLCMENGSAWLELLDSNAEPFKGVDENCDDSLLQRLNDVVAFAQSFEPLNHSSDVGK